MGQGAGTGKYQPTRSARYHVVPWPSTLVTTSDDSLEATEPKPPSGPPMTPAPEGPATGVRHRLATDAGSDPRQRLLRGVATAVADKGYVATTIADIVRHAHVSKRTFYEHFADKQSCYLEAYRRGTDRLGRRMLDAGRTAEGPWHERLRAGVAAYLRVLSDAPASTRTFTTEIQAAGAAAVAERRAMHRRTAEALLELVGRVRDDAPELRPLDPLVADGVVGAMTELVANAVADGQTAELSALEIPIMVLLASVLTAPEA